MKTKRFLYGLLALFFALLLIRASSYGTVGRFIERTGDRLIGSAGVALLIVILLVVAFRLLVPRSVRKWLLAFPELFHHEPVRAEVVARAPKRRAPPRQQLVVVTGADLQGLGLQGLMLAMNGGMEPTAALAPPVVAPRRIVAQPPEHTAPIIHAPVVSPLQRRKMDDVRGALKEMGFRAYEFEPIVAAMDPEAPIELLVRDALKVLAAPVPVRKV